MIVSTKIITFVEKQKIITVFDFFYLFKPIFYEKFTLLDMTHDSQRTVFRYAQKTCWKDCFGRKLFFSMSSSMRKTTNQSHFPSSLFHKNAPPQYRAYLLSRGQRASNRTYKLVLNPIQNYRKWTNGYSLEYKRHL